MTIHLENNVNTAHPDIDLTITVTESEMVNIKWNYAKKPATVKTPYEIPESIINIDMKPAKNIDMEDYVRISNVVGSNPKGEFYI